MLKLATPNLSKRRDFLTIRDSLEAISDVISLCIRVHAPAVDTSGADGVHASSGTRVAHAAQASHTGFVNATIAPSGRRCASRTSSRAKRAEVVSSSHCSRADAPTVARCSQPAAVIRATFAPGAPLMTAVTVTDAPCRTRSVCPGPATPSSVDAVSSSATSRDRARYERPQRNPSTMRGYRQSIRMHDRLRRADRLVFAVGVAAADGHNASTLPQQPLPNAKRQFIIEVPPTIPYLERVHVVKTELPRRSRQRHRRMGGDHQATSFADLGGEAWKHPVARAISPVDPAVR